MTPAAKAAASPEGAPALPRPLLAMLDASPAESLRELERALASRLHQVPSAAERREAELGLLAEMLFEAGYSRFDYAELAAEEDALPRIPRVEYDRRRARERQAWPQALESRVLSERFGSWLRACRAASGLFGFRRRKGAIRPWPNVHIGGRRNRNYTRGEVIDALMCAAEDLNRSVAMLTASAYYAWAAEQHRRAREQGAGLIAAVLTIRIRPQPNVPRQIQSDQDRWSRYPR
jgi:hypothetical protein